MSRQPIVLEDGTAKIKRARHYNKRLKIILSALTLLGLMVSTLYFYKIWNKENQAIETRLETFTELRHSTLLRFVTSLSKETELWASHENVASEARRYFEIWGRLSAYDRRALRAEYIHKSDNAKPSDMYAAYRIQHEKFNERRKKFMHHHGYYDVFYFNLAGDLVYTVEKEDDFGLNFNDGKYANSGLGIVFRKARDAKSGTAMFYDYAPYAPSNNAPASFLAAPMIDAKGKKIGVYAIQIPVSKFDTVMGYASGLGQTGETYVVGQDFLMRNNSRLSDAPTLLIKKIDTPAVRAALKGKFLLTKGQNEAGNKTLIAAQPLEFDQVKWAVATEMELSELRAPMKPYIWFYFITLAFVLIFGAVQYWLLRKKTVLHTL